jgi:phosphate starvation-inducible PhoH-like protein
VGQKSGLAVAVKILSEVDDIYIHAFSDKDVVRHKLVQAIIRAYEKYEKAAVERAAHKNNANRKQGDK